MCVSEKWEAVFNQVFHSHGSTNFTCGFQSAWWQQASRRGKHMDDLMSEIFIGLAWEGQSRKDLMDHRETGWRNPLLIKRNKNKNCIYYSLVQQIIISAFSFRHCSRYRRYYREQDRHNSSLIRLMVKFKIFLTRNSTFKSILLKKPCTEHLGDSVG